MKGNYIPRDISTSIVESAKYFPVVTVTGPRQSGKSTLLRHLFPDAPYYSLEDPDLRLFINNDPKGFLSKSGKEIIIDEIQNMPVLLSYMQGIVDENPDKRFYLTGSSQFSLLKNVTQSLAGRSAVFELLPLSLNEIDSSIANSNVNDLLYNGFYPAVWSNKNVASLLYPNYVKTYLERDVRDLLAIKDLDCFQRFVKLCAGRIGSVFVASELANEVGVSVNTINSWLSVLQASYIIFLLPPFHTNTRKRLTKSPKLYFTDCGIAAYLLEIGSPNMLDRDKMRGFLFENMIVADMLKNRYNRGVSGGIYFYRDSNGNEVDLLVRNGQKYDCYEIKSAMTYHSDFSKGLLSFEKAFPELVAKKSIIYPGSTLPEVNGLNVKNFIEK